MTLPYHLRPEVKARRAARRRERYETDPKYREREKRRSRRSHYLQRYGMTEEERDEMLRQQDGVCAICKMVDELGNWHVDHCHKTKKVRAILCLPCNVMLGKLEKSPKRLTDMLTYILEHQQ